MKKINLKSIRSEGFGKMNAANMKKIVGGYTLNTVTVTPSSIISSQSSNGDDGPDDWAQPD